MEAIYWHILIDVFVLGVGGLFIRYVQNIRKDLDTHLNEASGVKSDLKWIKETCNEIKSDVKKLEEKK